MNNNTRFARAGYTQTFRLGLPNSSSFQHVYFSAGIGRTRTYIALDILTLDTGRIDVPGCVLNMRQNRPNMIQTQVSHTLSLNVLLDINATVECYLNSFSRTLKPILIIVYELETPTGKL